MSLFWAVTLLSDFKGQHISRKYLSVFMLLPALLMFCHFLYFAPYPDLFVWFDLPLQFLGMLVFPLYHIYFRLLTVDDKISFRKHLRYQIFPIAIVSIYGIAVFSSSFHEYKAWLFNKTVNPVSPSVHFLQIMRTVFKVSFTTQCIYYIVANHLLINKYSDRAAQFYSDERDAKTRYAKLLNLSIILSGVVTLVLFVIGRTFLMSADNLIFIGWSTLAIAFYLMGSLGSRQKVINPEILDKNNDEPVQLLQPLVNDQDVLINKILVEFRENKLYLNSELTVQDVAIAVGSNRTYLSGVINQKFNQNFCAFVNGFRVHELESIMAENQDYLLDQYVVLCGFGSVNSMKRSVVANTGMSFHAFRSSLVAKHRA